jgi:hypothetical protein
MKPNAKIPHRYFGAIPGVALVASLYAAAMTLRLPTVEGASGATVDVAIDVAGAEKVGALQFEVVYDPAVLTAESARAGALATDALIEVKTDRPGRLFIALVTTNSINGSGTVAIASFRVIGAPGKSTTLEPAAAQAWEGITHREVLVTPAPGRLTVTERPFPWLWILIGVAVVLLVAILLKRRSRTREAKSPA